jgi:hypothetical protein
VKRKSSTSLQFILLVPLSLIILFAASSQGAEQWKDTFVGVPRAGGPAIWTGTEMIIWGGISGGFYLNTGGRYTP